MNKKISTILKKCKSISKLGRSSSTFRTSSMRCNSTRDYQVLLPSSAAEVVGPAVVFVGSSRRCYTISAKHLSHPLINALIDRSKTTCDDDDEKISVKCEVVLFDHLLWMLENANPDDVAADGSSLEELAQLYASS